MSYHESPHDRKALDDVFRQRVETAIAYAEEELRGNARDIENLTGRRHTLKLVTWRAACFDRKYRLEHMRDTLKMLIVED